MICPGFGAESTSGAFTNSMAECPIAASSHQVRQELKGLPLGPDSLLWNYFDNRMALVAATGIKQLMMHGIDAGVDQHSQFFNEIVERTFRSMVQIGDTVFDLEKGQEMGRKIRNLHLNVKGIDAQGDRYHALNPKLFADTHLTFVDGVFEVADRFDGHNLTDDEREILYQESITWYHQYGVSDRYLPENYTSYKERSDEMANEYVLTSTAKRALQYAVTGNIPRPNAVPSLFWRAIGVPLKPAANFLGAVVVSGLPEQVRDKYKKEIPYSLVDELQVAALETAVKSIDWDRVPGWIRYPRPAFDAFRREGRYNGITDNAFALGTTAAFAAIAPPMKFARSIAKFAA